MKYIIIKVDAGSFSRYFPIIFPNNLVHKQVAERMRHMIGFDNLEGNAEIYSAGFCLIGNEQIDVSLHGSESLRIETDIEQRAIDFRILNLPACMQGILP